MKFGRPFLRHSILGTICFSARSRLTSNPRPLPILLPCPSALASTRRYTNISRDTTAIKNAPGFYIEPTIYALSTAQGSAGIAVIRISGSSCLKIYRSLCPNKGLPKPRTATLRSLFHPVLHDIVIDTAALVLYFPTPRSVTGEDVLELHVHGGSATVKAVLAAISQCGSASEIRYAEPGEFTRRAFQHGQLDLAQVESLSDTLSAETEQQRRAAVHGNSGLLGRRYEQWREGLLQARGELEAFIDFYEDQDLDVEQTAMLESIRIQVQQIHDALGVHIEGGARGELLRKGIALAIVGHPNAGKSSFLNRVIGREASIVSSEAGTTRDIVEVSLDIAGYLCTLADTAGIRGNGIGCEDVQANILEDIGQVEAEGIRRAIIKAQTVDVVVCFMSVEREHPTQWHLKYDLKAIRIALAAPQHLLVINKVDLVSRGQLSGLVRRLQRETAAHSLTIADNDLVFLSCAASDSDQTSSYFKDLMSRLVSTFEGMTHLEHVELFGVTERQNQLLRQCQHHLQDYLTDFANEHRQDDLDGDVVLAAEHLRYAADCLSRITGRGGAGDAEEVLGVVFEK